MSVLKNKKITVGVCGGIAVYKVCDLVRKLVLLGADVNVAMTKNACRFVTPLTFQTLSSNKVSSDLFDSERDAEIGHIALADSADVIVVAPATSTIIGKTVSGIADNLITAVILATKAPVIFCPSMNVNMFHNPIVQDNLHKLNEYGYRIIEPSEGSLACGWEGKGRLPDTHIIVQEIERVLSAGDLAGEKVLVTAGPTREYIDPVRFISNPSSGKMGISIARAAWRRGAEVVLISGKTGEGIPHGVANIQIESAEQMYDQVNKYYGWASVVIKSAAVGDYAPKNYSDEKINKDKNEVTISLNKTKDILYELGKNKGTRMLVGFAAETSNILENAKKKLIEKNLDLIVVNDITKEGAGFEVDTNSAVILDRFCEKYEYGTMPKDQLADIIIDNVLRVKSRISF
jgi:phosphopantothenoylcysteine decarboxylase / phosphopantothenate---cysteine ligase